MRLTLEYEGKKLQVEVKTKRFFENDPYTGIDSELWDLSDKDTMAKVLAWLSTYAHDVLDYMIETTTTDGSGLKVTTDEYDRNMALITTDHTDLYAVWYDADEWNEDEDDWDAEYMPEPFDMCPCDFTGYCAGTSCSRYFECNR